MHQSADGSGRIGVAAWVTCGHGSDQPPRALPASLPKPMFDLRPMGRSLSHEVARGASLAKYGVSPFRVYHPDVIASNPSYFSSTWRSFWGLP